METKGHQMLLYCCRHPSRIIRLVASVLEMRCREYLRLFYILVVFMYVYMCIYIHTHLHLSTPFHSTRTFLLSDCRLLFSFFFSPVDLDSDYNVLVDPIEDKMSRTYQIETDF